MCAVTSFLTLVSFSSPARSWPSTLLKGRSSMAGVSDLLSHYSKQDSGV